MEIRNDELNYTCRYGSHGRVDIILTDMDTGYLMQLRYEDFHPDTGKMIVMVHDVDLEGHSFDEAQIAALQRIESSVPLLEDMLYQENIFQGDRYSTRSFSPPG